MIKKDPLTFLETLAAEIKKPGLDINVIPAQEIA
jgi:hypothetical protein